MIKSRHFDWPAHLLHWLFALGVTFQLFSSIWMHHTAKAGRAQWTLNLFFYHQTIGMVVLVLLILYILRSLMLIEQGKDKLGHLFPYQSSQRAVIWQDIKRLVRFDIPEHSSGGLAGAVQGAILVWVTAVAITGFMWFSVQGNAASATLAYALKETHEWLASWVWYFVGAHAVMGIIHGIRQLFRG